MRRHHDRPVWVGQPWCVVLRDVGLDAEAVLRRAGQPSNLFDGDGSWISVDDFYDLFEAVEVEAGGPEVAVRAGAVVSAELFDPAYFAAMCSSDLTTALTRLGEHMEIVGPFLLDVEVTATETAARYGCKVRPDVAPVLGLSQLAFIVALARRATRHEIVPRRVTVVGRADDLGACSDFFGCDVVGGDVFEVKFSELGIGSRTLQRRLAGESTSWLDVLNGTRERLARHYFGSTDLNATEIGFLLGFADPNSLFRAFHRWTGMTPEAFRAEVRSSG